MTNDAVIIRDDGAVRTVSGGGVSLQTPLSEEFICMLGQLRPGTDLLDELLRSEHPPYIRERLDLLLPPAPERTSWRVLDYGCGAGASSVVLAHLGVPKVVGVDLDNSLAPIWERRMTESGFPGVGTFVRAEDSVHLPFESRSFDAVLLNGVMEHLTPEERPLVLREAFRLVRRGGRLFISETPNPLFPRHSHTKIWFSELLPFRLAVWYAVHRGLRRDFPRTNRTAQYRTGFRGMSLFAMKGQLGREARLLPGDPLLAQRELTLPRSPLHASRKQSAFVPLAWRVIQGLALITGTEPAFWAPHVNAAFERVED